MSRNTSVDSVSVSVLMLTTGSGVGPSDLVTSIGAIIDGEVVSAAEIKKPRLIDGKQEKG